MANRYPLVIDTSNGNNFAELPEGDNLILTNSSIVNALNISAIGTIATQVLEVDGTLVTGSYNDLTDKPDIPDSILDLGIDDGQSGYILQANGDGTFRFVSRQSANVGNYQFTDNLITVESDDLEIGSPANILLNPTNNVLISNGTSLVFKGAAPDEFGAALQLGTITADRDVIIPDEDGTLATREWINDQGFTFDVNLQTALNDINQLETDVSNLGTDVSNNSSDISILQVATSNITADVSNLGSRVGTNEGDISSIQTFISNLATVSLTGEYGDLLNSPSIPADLSDLTDTTNIIPADLSDLTDTTNIIPADLSDLTDTTNIIPTTLTDLSITDGTNGQVLTTDGEGGFSFTTVSSSGGATVIDDLTDVNTIGVQIGDVLSFDGAVWVPAAGGGGGASTLGALTDVDLSIPPFDGDVLTYEATSMTWIPIPPVGGSGSQNVFANIAVAGQTTVAADSTTDTLTLVAGAGISITTDAGTDTITITNTGGGSSFDQTLNTTDDVQFNSVTSTTSFTATEFVSSGAGVPTITSASNIVLDATNAVVIQGSPVRLSVYTTTEATALAGQAGDTIYVSDGDAGSPCLAVHDGTSWKRVSLGATISGV